MVEPFTAFFAWLGTAIGGTTGAFLIMNATALAYTALVAASIAYGNAQQRKAERRAINAYNDTLRDRHIMIRTASSPSPWALGLSKLSGPVVFAHTTSSSPGWNDILHLVIPLARHECDAIEAIYFNEIELDPENPVTGAVETGPFSLTRKELFIEDYTSNGSGVITLVRNTAEAPSVSNGINSGNPLDNPSIPVGYTHTVGTNTISGLAASTLYTVTYYGTNINSFVKIRKHLGAPGQVADADLVADSGGAWTSSDKGTNTCYIYVRLIYNQDVFGQIGIPNISARVRGKKLFDPRTGLTVYSTNAALAAAAYLKDQTFGIRSASGEVPDAELITAANIADEDVTMFNTGTVQVQNGSPSITFSDTTNAKKRVRKGMTLVVGANRVKLKTFNNGPGAATGVLESNYPGTTNLTAPFAVVQTRYTVNGALSSANTPWDNLEEICKSMAGSSVWCQGRWLVRAGAYEAPSLTLNEDYFANASVQILPRKGRRDLFNGVQGRYVNVNLNLAEDTYPSYTSSAYETEDGEQILIPYNFDLVIDGTACQRLAKILVLQGRQALTVKITTNLRAYNLTPMGSVTLNVARYGWSSKVFVVLSREYNIVEKKIEYLLQETSPTVWDWLYAEQAGIDPAPNTTLPSPNTPPARLTSFAAVAGTSELARLSDGTIVSRAKVTWDMHPELFVREGGRIELRWRYANATTSGSISSAPGDSTSAYLDNMPEGRYVMIDGRAVTANSKESDWTTYGPLLITGKSAPPANVSGLTYDQMPDGIRVRWTPNTELDYLETELRVGASWVAGTFLFKGATSQYPWINPLYGSYTVWAAHRDTSLNYSATPQSISIVVLNKSDTTFVAHGSGVMDLVGQTALKSSGSSAWDTGVYSQNGIQGACSASARVYGTTTLRMFGLNTDPTTDASYSSLDHAIYVDTTVVRIYESGSLIVDLGAIHASGYQYEVLYDGSSVKYYQNGGLLFQRGVAPNQTFYFDSSFYSVGADLTNMLFRPMSAGQRGNLLDASTWTAGSSDKGVAGGSRWVRAATPTSEDTVVFEPGPDGLVVPLWKSTSSDNEPTNSADGGYVTDWVPIDHLKAYRQAVFVMCNASGALDGTVYLGIANNTVRSIPGTLDGNPYTNVVSRSNLAKLRWYLVVGYVLPSNFGTTVPNPVIGAVYDCSTGQRVREADNDYKWEVGIGQTYLRAYQFYASSGQVQYFWNPRFEMIDGSEPTVDQLLALAKPSLSRPLTNDFEALYDLNGQFHKWPLGASAPSGWIANGSPTIRNETTVFRTGPNAVYLSSGSDGHGLRRELYWTSQPYEAGTFIEGTVDAYLVVHTSGGYPGILLRVYVDAALTTYRDNIYQLPNTATGAWQTIAFKASVLPGERIYGVIIYLLCSWVSLPSGVGNNDVIFDSVTARAVRPSDTLQLRESSVTSKSVAAAGGSSVSWTNAASDFDAWTGSNNGPTGSVLFTHESSRNEYLIDMHSQIQLAAGSNLVESVSGFAKLVLRDITANTAGVVHTLLKFVHRTYVDPLNVTGRNGNANVTLSYAITTSAGLTVGNQYRATMYVTGIRAINSAGSQIAPGASSSVSAELNTRVMITKA